MMLDLDALDFAKGGGLVCVVTQHALTGEVLMVAFADREALERTLATGEMHYRSRTRGLWHKGESSGNVQRLVRLTPDCDGDAVLAQVLPAGPACHAGTPSCFPGADPEPLLALERTLEQRAREPAGGGYTRRLLADENLRLKKLGEETAELLVALARGDRERSVEEGADLVYHLLVALRAAGASLSDLRRALAARDRRRDADAPPIRSTTIAR